MAERALAARRCPWARVSRARRTFRGATAIAYALAALRRSCPPGVAAALRAAFARFLPHIVQHHAPLERGRAQMRGDGHRRQSSLPPSPAQSEIFLYRAMIHSSGSDYAVPTLVRATRV